jgi:hypothetical protein
MMTQQWYCLCVSSDDITVVLLSEQRLVLTC